jgi:YgiT-type zinc finger domain-containing protein
VAGRARKDLAAVAVDWEALAAEVLVGIKDWRTQHPRATFTEIEQELDRELSRLRTRLLEDVALASAATGGVGGRPEATCPTCGGALVARGQATRAVTVTHNQTVMLPRQYAVCSSCGAGVFPPG